MLLTRCVLFLAFTTVQSGDALPMPTNMFITSLVVLLILVYKLIISTKIYQHRYVSLLELCFLVNLEVLSASVYYAYLNKDLDTTACKITSASISLSLLGFIVILAYHAHLQLKKTRLYLSLTKLRILRKCPSFLQRAHTQDIVPPASHETDAGKEAPTTSYVGGGGTCLVLCLTF